MRNSAALRFITHTALGIALVLLAQLAGRVFPAGAVILGPLSLSQLITGSLVNCVLFVFAALSGPLVGIVIGFCSAVLAFMLGIGPALIQLVPLIAYGNALLALLFGLAAKKDKPLGLAMPVSAAAKCAFLWLLVPVVLSTLAQLPEKKAALMSAMFSWPQGVTALIGGLLAIVIIPRLKKARSN